LRVRPLLTQACQAVVAAFDITCNVLSHCYNLYACFNCHTPRHHCASFELVLIWTKLMVVDGWPTPTYTCECKLVNTATQVSLSLLAKPTPSS
jgi:hypothetical protein